MKKLKQDITQYRSQQTESIAKLLRYQIEDEETSFDVDICTIVDDLEEDMITYRQSESQNIYDYLRNIYGSQVQVAFNIIKEFKEESKKITGNMNELKRMNARVGNILSWLHFNMSNLSEDIINKQSFFNYMDAIQVHTLDKHCSFFLAEYLLQEMFSIAGQRSIEYVHVKGSSLLYLEVFLLEQDTSNSLPTYLETKFEKCEDDLDQVKTFKKKIKNALLSFNSKCNLNLKTLYNDTKASHAFMKRLISNLGLPIRCGKRSHKKCKLSQVSILPEDIALCFCIKP